MLLNVLWAETQWNRVYFKNHWRRKSEVNRTVGNPWMISASHEQGVILKKYFTRCSFAYDEKEMKWRKRETGECWVKIVRASHDWVCASLRRGYFHSSIVFVSREENPVRASFACRNETAASLRHPPTQPLIGIPSYRCADESHSPETGIPRRLPCPLYCLPRCELYNILKTNRLNGGTGRHWKGQEPS